jgi:hypothetical protein
MSKKKQAKRKSVLYLHVDTETKKWLKRLCAKQPGKVSQSLMAEQLFARARQSGVFDSR